MFTSDQRQETLDKLVDIFKAREEISAVILVGSASYGFRDKYSDIDLALVYNESCSLDAIFQKTFEDISSKYNVPVCLNQIGRSLQVILLNNYLEIDIGYYTLNSLCARRCEYSIVYDKTNSVKDIMDSSWNDNKDKNMGTVAKVDIGNELFKIDANLWYNTIHTVNAFNRDEKYRYYYELSELRNNIISLIGKRNNVETKRFRSVHKLSDDEKLKIDSLFLYPETAERLKVVLCTMLDMFYEEFTYWSFSPRVEKEFIKTYITDNL